MNDRLPIEDLILDEQNPRTITEKQMQKLVKSIKEDPGFLEARPVLVNKLDGKYYVYGGNQRVRAAKLLGHKMIACHIGENLDESQIKARIIKDNQHFGEWDFDILANEWDEDILLDAGFSEKDLQLLDDEEIKENEDDEEAKDQTKCPECGKIMD